MNKKPPKNIVGPTMRKLRCDLGLTQEQLAVICRESRVWLTRSSVAKIEAEIRRISDCELYAVAKSLGVAMEQMFPPNALDLIKRQALLKT